MRNVNVDGIAYMVARDGYGPDGDARWKLSRWVPTWGTGGAWHPESFVYLPVGSTDEMACKRLLGLPRVACAGCRNPIDSVPVVIGEQRFCSEACYAP